MTHVTETEFVDLVQAAKSQKDLLEQVALDLDYLMRCVSAAMADLGCLEGIRTD